MGQVLYRKYRSQSFKDIVGQDHIISTLSKAVEKNRIAHAYLFTGPRGTGKTSVARILAYMVNNVDYDEKQNYTDIIEIDAASNRRIDEIRKLRDTVNTVPSVLKYKVYIIDEVHMLTNEAFNALLKTLEEPPSHAIFILATTELHKVPETITSRCQKFVFNSATFEDLKGHLESIVKLEKIAIDEDSLDLIAKRSMGSYRDGLSILDQLASLHTSITANQTRSILGISNIETVSRIVGALEDGNSAQLKSTLSTAYFNGDNAIILSQQVSSELRKFVTQSDHPKQVLELLKNLLEIGASVDPEAFLEICLLEYIHNFPTVTPIEIPSARPVSPSPVTPPKPETDKEDVIKKSAKSKAKNDDLTKPKTKAIKQAKNLENLAKPDESTNIDPKSKAKTKNNVVLHKLREEDWVEILNIIKPKRTTLYGVLRLASPSYENSVLTLTFGFVFHHKQASEPANSRFIEDTFRDFGFDISEINLVHTAGHKSKPLASSEPEQVNDVEPINVEPVAEDLAVPDEILNIFAGTEVVD